MTLEELSIHCLYVNQCNGFLIGDIDQFRQIARIAGEAHEALDAIDRGFKGDHSIIDINGNIKEIGSNSELIDVLIRTLSLLRAIGVNDIESRIMRKIEYNRTRGHKHGKVGHE